MIKRDPEERSGGGKECLVFNLGGENYAIDILKVQEIRGYETATRIANVPDYIKGIINLRGAVVPIIDMRLKFRLGDAAYDQSTVVIVLNIAQRIVGMVVDGVSDVISLLGEHLRPAPELGSAVDIGYMTGVGVIDGRTILLVEIEKLLSSADLDISPPEVA